MAKVIRMDVMLDLLHQTGSSMFDEFSIKLHDIAHEMAFTISMELGIDCQIHGHGAFFTNAIACSLSLRNKSDTWPEVILELDEDAFDVTRM